MDYKALEEMYGGIPENTEMDKLIDYLKICPPGKVYLFRYRMLWPSTSHFYGLSDRRTSSRLRVP